MEGGSEIALKHSQIHSFGPQVWEPAVSQKIHVSPLKILPCLVVKDPYTALPRGINVVWRPSATSLCHHRVAQQKRHLKISRISQPLPEVLRHLHQSPHGAQNSPGNIGGFKQTVFAGKSQESRMIFREKHLHFVRGFPSNNATGLIFRAESPWKKSHHLSDLSHCVPPVPLGVDASEFLLRSRSKKNHHRPFFLVKTPGRPRLRWWHTSLSATWVNQGPSQH